MQESLHSNLCPSDSEAQEMGWLTYLRLLVPQIRLTSVSAQFPKTKNNVSAK